MASLKTAFEVYFKKLTDFNQQKFNKLPTVTYTDTLNSDLLISTADTNGDIEWQPKLQTTPVDWSTLEVTLGFSVCEELKEYYSSYLFLTLAGGYKDIAKQLNFEAIADQNAIPQIILRQSKDGQYYFPNTQIFLLGNALINGDDSFGVYFDNQNGTIFCYEDDTKNRISLSDSLANIIEGMSPGV